MSGFAKPPAGATLIYDHPLAQGLVGCWLFAEGSGAVVHDSGPRLKTGASTSSTWTNTTKGTGIQFGTGLTEQVFVSANALLATLVNASCEVMFLKIGTLQGP